MISKHEKAYEAQGAKSRELSIAFECFDIMGRHEGFKNQWSNPLEYSMDYFWGTFGVIHGVVLRHFWSTFGVFLEYFWGTFGVLLEYFFGQFWSSFGILLGTFGVLYVFMA